MKATWPSQWQWPLRWCRRSRGNVASARTRSSYAVPGVSTRPPTRRSAPSAQAGYRSSRWPRTYPASGGSRAQGAVGECYSSDTDPCGTFDRWIGTVGKKDKTLYNEGLLWCVLPSWCTGRAHEYHAPYFFFLFLSDTMRFTFIKHVYPKIVVISLGGGGDGWMGFEFTWKNWFDGRLVYWGTTLSS